MISKQNVYLTADRSHAVAEGDKDAKWLLVREGHEIENAEAGKYEDALDLIGSEVKKKAAKSVEEPSKPAPKAAKKKAKKAKKAAK